MPDSVSQPAPVIDLGAFLVRCRRQRLLLSLAIFAGIGLGAIWHLVTRPVYEAITTMVPVPTDSVAVLPGLPGGSELSRLIGSGSPEGVSRKDEALAILLSRDFLHGFIAEMGLLQPLTEPGLMGTLRRRIVGSGEPKLVDAYDRLVAEVIAVREDRRTGLIELRVRWHDPVMTVRWAEELVARLNRTMQVKSRQRAEADLRFLQEELRRTETVEVRQAIFRLIESQLKTVMLANISDDFALRVIDPPVQPDQDRPIGLGLVARMALLATATLGVVLGWLLARSIGTSAAA